MSTQPTQESEGERLAHELRHEVSSLAHHPVEEVRRLTHVAADGKNATTPLLVALSVIGLVGLILAVVLTLAMLAYYLA